MCCPERGGLYDYSFAEIKNFEHWLKILTTDTIIWIWNLHADAHA
ncbi:hypothetical protein DCAR_0727595 [Daucus carota subsp. sativus]|uniref:Uncharacterized protein n=1 Tax=Daucus carota subsp. sativus TaxID=79200 RepID=A0AAF0XHM5_DAUCS|nr:hypothetical protein DCAR_0727595 [Daucus carota subsp. sativus]